ncbi:MAG: sulfite exporter TauE/SafE family protein [Capsulimonadaceae bacterium]|nr:sulfite exporter TauE/SafE family protein [Capsulimonadaceae bacterium]
MTDLLLPFFSGLTGGFSHCIGMCGVFVLSAASVGRSGSGRPDYAAAAARQAMFHGGRLLSLLVLGVVAGSLGSLASFRGHVPLAQTGLSFAAAIALGALALGQLGIAPALRIPEPDVMAAGGGKGRALFARIFRSKALLRPLALGFMVGLLPCGLTYYVLLYGIATASPASSALMMASFWLGTVPGLAAIGMTAGVAGSLLRPSTAVRVGMSRLSGIILLLMAALLAFRGWETLRAL